MIILKTLWDIIQSIFITILVLYILYGIGVFFDWIEYKRFAKVLMKNNPNINIDGDDGK